MVKPTSTNSVRPPTWLGLIELRVLRTKSRHRHLSEMGCLCSDGSHSRDPGICLYELGSQQSLWQ
jgi:hypothetical protein